MVVPFRACGVITRSCCTGLGDVCSVEFLAGLSHIERVEPLGYHAIAQAKYAALDRVGI
jgi:hypothetical protein